MPIIPTPPPMTLSQKIQTIQTINAMPTQSNIVQQITDLAREQAKIALDELMKQEQEKRKQTILTIENIDKIKGHKYSEWLEVGGLWNRTRIMNLLYWVLEVLIRLKQYFYIGGRHPIKGI